MGDGSISLLRIFSEVYTLQGLAISPPISSTLFSPYLSLRPPMYIPSSSHAPLLLLDKPGATHSPTSPFTFPRGSVWGWSAEGLNWDNIIMPALYPSFFFPFACLPPPYTFLSPIPFIPMLITCVFLDIHTTINKTYLQLMRTHKHTPVPVPVPPHMEGLSIVSQSGALWGTPSAQRLWGSASAATALIHSCNASQALYFTVSSNYRFFIRSLTDRHPLYFLPSPCAPSL